MLRENLNNIMLSIIYSEVDSDDCRDKSTKKAESSLTLPEVAFNILKSIS